MAKATKTAEKHAQHLLAALQRMDEAIDALHDVDYALGEACRIDHSDEPARLLAQGVMLVAGNLRRQIRESHEMAETAATVYRPKGGAM